MLTYLKKKKMKELMKSDSTQLTPILKDLKKKMQKKIAQLLLFKVSKLGPRYYEKQSRHTVVH